MCGERACEGGRKGIGECSYRVSDSSQAVRKNTAFSGTDRPLPGTVCVFVRTGTAADDPAGDRLPELCGSPAGGRQAPRQCGDAA